MSPIPLRAYVDTSVFGGPFDDEFGWASRVFFDQVRGGRFALVTSGLVLAELRPAPPQVQSLYDELLPHTVVAEITPEALALRKAYLEAGILTKQSADDALHVALATVSECSMIVSWNFRHIVHFRKIPMYNAVNVLKGYGRIAIHSPREVIEYEDV